MHIFCCIRVDGASSCSKLCSYRYQNSVAVEKRVFKNLNLFMENKNDGDDLFDRINVSYHVHIF